MSYQFFFQIIIIFLIPRLILSLGKFSSTKVVAWFSPRLDYFLQDYLLQEVSYFIITYLLATESFPQDLI